MTVEGRLLWVYSGEQAAENQAGYGSKTRRGKEGKGPSFTIRPIHQPSPFQNSDPKGSFGHSARYEYLLLIKIVGFVISIYGISRRCLSNLKTIDHYIIMLPLPHFSSISPVYV